MVRHRLPVRSSPSKITRPPVLREDNGFVLIRLAARWAAAARTLQEPPITAEAEATTSS